MDWFKCSYNVIFNSGLNMNCGCIVRNGKVIESCAIHVELLKKTRNVVASLIEARVDRILKTTFLHELRGEIITEIRKVRQ